MHNQRLLVALASLAPLVSSQGLVSGGIDLGLNPAETSLILSIATDPAALASATSELGAIPGVASALASEFDGLFNALPSTVVAAIPSSLDSAFQNPSAIESLFAQYQTAYAAGAVPTWFDTLPPAAQSEWNSIYSLIAGPAPTAAPAGNASANSSSPALFTGHAARPSGTLSACIAGAVGILALAIAL
ncbi:MAG: hypothetical protein M1838_001490 [Thelocarpon superellum]|nr:MAG: hypothetical protein M1838_001490 [Thelocarpon superellum]